VESYVKLCHRGVMLGVSAIQHHCGAPAGRTVSVQMSIDWWPLAKTQLEIRYAKQFAYVGGLIYIARQAISSSLMVRILLAEFGDIQKFVDHVPNAFTFKFELLA